ncbi:L-ribulose-5-phosphate 4-epimerase [Leptolinea tardivitalis]|uniref:L-ribulose-5-phosphate 4-epimerase n=1 Tax=Leptolinea tardivitalis TaxID=229920 RepID=A0A0P6X3L3_9CHLR|nr:L-ribulose-5-phosphate 4-epimerase [Leptolinea tardivitalis]KPL74009.1 ribulose 5-phosphate epimerase [Leptolinea tardivitalis]GAP22645.1 L-ribulose 5-phosphate 4-epimerase [Leptolinea tardivitalis]
MLENLKKELVDLHMKLVENHLVVWTGGNVSARDPETGLIVIKASGVPYEGMGPEHMVVMDLDGKVVEGKYKPSSDAFSHIYVYKHRADVFGMVHTHSNYATAFAAVGQPIPCVLTSMGDEFGCDIPCGGFVLIGDDAIGKEVLDNIGMSTACLIQNHGVFTIGDSARAAVKSAVMVEDAAHTVWIAKQLGSVIPISKENVEKLHYRYTHIYGQ